MVSREEADVAVGVHGIDDRPVQPRRLRRRQGHEDNNQEGRDQKGRDQERREEGALILCWLQASRSSTATGSFLARGAAMCKLPALILMACLGLWLTGCGSDKDKNINKD